MLEVVFRGSAAWLRRLSMAATLAYAMHPAFAVAPAAHAMQPSKSFGLRALPPGLNFTESDADLVAVVATDIDTDGDLDIVATDSDLRLHVWINDGAGHFTRREPSRLPTWHDDPAGPRFDDRQAAVEALTQSRPPSVNPESRAHVTSTPVSACATTSVSGGAGTDLIVGPPRAPPPALID
jgi:hypothetical protein